MKGKTSEKGFVISHLVTKPKIPSYNSVTEFNGMLNRDLRACLGMLLISVLQHINSFLNGCPGVIYNHCFAMNPMKFHD